MLMLKPPVMTTLLQFSKLPFKWQLPVTVKNVILRFESSLTLAYKSLHGELLLCIILSKRMITMI